MRLESMRNKLLELLAPKYAVAVALVLVLAFGGALGATKGLEQNRLDGIQLVQESEDAEGTEAGEDAEDSEGGEDSEYPPELGEDAEVAEDGEDGGEDGEAGEGTESEADPPAAGEATIVSDGVPPNTEFNATVIDSEGNEFPIGTVDSDSGGRVPFIVPDGAASGDATLRLDPTGTPPGDTQDVPFEIASFFESAMVSFSIGGAILLVLGGVLFAVVRRRRSATSA